MHKCEICDGTYHVTYYRKYKKYLCNKHYLQLHRYGEIKEYTKHSPNKIIKYDTYACIECIDSIGNKFYSKIDLEDIEKCQEYKWHIDKSNSYIRTSSNSKNFKLHRFILNEDGDLFIDHINNDRTDNRKCNLRIVTPKQNALNTILSSNNTSSYKGIHKQGDKWVVKLRYDNKTIYLGWYNSFIDALKVRIKNEIKYYKQFANYDLIYNVLRDNKLEIGDII